MQSNHTSGFMPPAILKAHLNFSTLFAALLRPLKWPYKAFKGLARPPRALQGPLLQYYYKNTETYNNNENTHTHTQKQRNTNRKNKPEHRTPQTLS